jgi:hypothetical protein
MPKVKFSNTKGLVQTTGGGVEFAGSTIKLTGGAKFDGDFSGQRTAVSAVKSAGFTASAADSGKIILLGTQGGTVVLPTANVGWNATFVVTGALGAAWVLSGSTTGTKFLTGSIVGSDDGAISSNITAYHSGAGGNGYNPEGNTTSCVSMSNGCALLNDTPGTATLEKITSTIFLVKGSAYT